MNNRGKLNIIFYIIGVGFLSFSMYDMTYVWNFKDINGAFIQGISSCGLAILFIYVPRSILRCKECNPSGNVSNDVTDKESRK
jgi:hypothetical protein